MRARIEVAERCGCFLSSRRIAHQLRDELIELIAKGHAVTVSFSGVESISNSFADGFLGLLIAERGRLWFDEHVAIEGLDPEDQADLETVVTWRIQQESAVA